jgi:hypothetical protein
MNSNINKEILTEIKRISQLMSINEQVDDIVKGVARTELANVVRNEIRAAVKAAVKKEGYEAVQSSIKNGTRDLSKSAQIYQNIYKSLGRELNAQEKILVRTEASKLMKTESLKILQQEKNALTRLAAKASTGVKNIAAKIKKLASGGTKELKPTVAKTSQVESQIAKIGAKEEQELIEGITKKGWNWGRTIKWATRLGITVTALWFFFYDKKNVPAPSDIPENNSNLGGSGTGGTSGTSGSKYTKCSEELPIKQFCKNETIRKVQACLAMPSNFQTGNFGPITQGYLEGKGQNGTLITTETIIAVCGTNSDIAGATAGKTGYEDYTTDEIETSVEEPTNQMMGSDVIEQ